MPKNYTPLLLLTITTIALSGCNLTTKENTTNKNSNSNKEITTLYECEQNLTDKKEKQSCKDTILENTTYVGYFYGHECNDTENCLAQQEGYEWADENNISSEINCPEYSYEFGIGCQYFVEDQNNTIPEDQEFTEREQKAEQLIRSLETVKNWLAQFSNPDGSSPITGGKPIIALERNEYDLITFHLYENMNERNVTFDWYDVDMDTMKVTNMMQEEVK
jgi:hypothetical protein